MSDTLIIDREKMLVQFNCHGVATGKMRNDLSVSMVQANVVCHRYKTTGDWTEV